MLVVADVVERRIFPNATKDQSMQIWVDADACPGEIKELLFRAAKRTKTKVTLVAN